MIPFIVLKVRFCSEVEFLKMVSCRYKEYLSPDIVQGPWKRDEDLAILYGQHTLGNKWAKM